MSSPMTEVALSYIALGFKVFPVKANKKPFTQHGLRDATQVRADVEEYWARWPTAGIGLVTDGFVVLDFDPKNGGFESKADMEAKCGQLTRTRTHRTGGGGLHVIYRNPNGANIRNTVDLGGYAGVDLRANGGYIVAPPSLHRSGRCYEVLDECQIALAPHWLVELAHKRPATSAIASGSLPIPEGQRNDTLARLAGVMRRHGMLREPIESALLEVNRLQCQPPLPEHEVEAIARSVSRYPPNNGSNVRVCICERDNVAPSTNGTQTGQRTGQSLMESGGELRPVFAPMSSRVLAWVRDTIGWWSTSDLDSDLGITGARAKENRKKILQRLREQGMIEPHTKINKQWRYVNQKVTSLDFKRAAAAGVLPLKWPLRIERFVNLFPGNTAVVAGSPNAGKTALLLDFIRLNMDQFPIYYFCSEMGADELRDRLEHFPGMTIDDWHFEALERAGDFADVVRPDCVNIIDFLEMTDELYRVNSHLTAISHKIGSGLAVVALQKKENAKYGRGQEFGVEKPKLYLSMDDGRLTIIKGKSWANPKVDPNDLSVGFKIVGGCQFEVTREWG